MRQCVRDPFQCCVECCGAAPFIGSITITQKWARARAMNIINEIITVSGAMNIINDWTAHNFTLEGVMKLKFAPFCSSSNALSDFLKIKGRLLECEGLLS